MIFIFDNGHIYSDHELHFIDIGNVSVKHAIALCKMRYRHGYHVGSADKIEWRDGDATTDLIDFACASLPGLADEDAEIPDVPSDLLMAMYTREKSRIRELLEQSAGNPSWHRNVKRRDSDLETVRQRIEGRTS